MHRSAASSTPGALRSRRHRERVNAGKAVGRRMRHNGSPMLRWQAGNVIVETDAAANRKPSKSKSIDRIDAIVAAIMACGIAERPIEEETPLDHMAMVA